jgi:hypothetical protein
MPLNLGNSQEIIATKISLIQGNAVNDILSIIAAGGGSGTVTSATAPLTISGSGVLTINLGAYATASAVNSLLANYTLTSALFAGVSVGAGLVSVSNAGSLSLALTGTESRASLRLADSGGTVRQLTSTTGGVLAWEAAPVALATDLANKIDALTVAAPLAISGTGTSRALSLLWKPSTVTAGPSLSAVANDAAGTLALTLLWKPSTVTAGSGLAAVANDAAGTLALTLDGSESRALLKLVDSGGTVRNLAASQTGALVWNASQLVDINALSGYSTTAQTAVLLMAKQATISATTNLTLQDVACRFLTGGSASVAFAISSGGAMTLFKDSSNNTLLTLENAVVTIPRPLTCEQAATFRQAVTLTNTAASLSGQLYVAAGNKLTWQGQEVVDLPTLYAELIAKVTFGSEFTRLANNSTGAISVTLNQAFQHSIVAFTQTSKTLRCIIQNSVENLTWDGDALATQAHVTAQTATKQDTLNFLSETSASGNLDLSNETAATPVYISWPGYTTANVINATGYQVLAHVYKMYSSLTAGATLYFDCEFRSGTTSSVIVSVNDSTAWTGVQYLVVSGLSTSTWKSVSWSWTGYANGNTNFHIGPTPPGVTAQPAGNVHIRNYKVSTSPNASAFTSQISVAGNIACAANISCVALTQTSDESIKTAYQDPTEDLLKIFDGASVYSYERDDIPGRRVGFKAQEIQANVPKEISNLVFMSYERDQPLLALDYSRIAATVLWAQCKAQQTALQELTQRVASLEASQASSQSDARPSGVGPSGQVGTRKKK